MEKKDEILLQVGLHFETEEQAERFKSAPFVVITHLKKSLLIECNASSLEWLVGLIRQSYTLSKAIEVHMD